MVCGDDSAARSRAQVSAEELNSVTDFFNPDNFPWMPPSHWIDRFVLPRGESALLSDPSYVNPSHVIIGGNSRDGVSPFGET